MGNFFLVSGILLAMISYLYTAKLNNSNGLIDFSLQKAFVRVTSFLILANVIGQIA